MAKIILKPLLIACIVVELIELTAQIPVDNSLYQTIPYSYRDLNEADRIAPVDDLETAEAVVFRPLFAYRRLAANRKRLHNRRYSNKYRRQSINFDNSYRYPSGIYVPAFGYNSPDGFPTIR